MSAKRLHEPYKLNSTYIFFFFLFFIYLFIFIFLHISLMTPVCGWFCSLQVICIYCKLIQVCKWRDLSQWSPLWTPQTPSARIILLCADGHLPADD